MRDFYLTRNCGLYFEITANVYNIELVELSTKSKHLMKKDKQE